jgi:hypothetical protein
MTFRLHQVVELYYQEPFLILGLRMYLLVENMFIDKKKVINIMANPVYSEIIYL